MNGVSSGCVPTTPVTCASWRSRMTTGGSRRCEAACCCSRLTWVSAATLLVHQNVSRISAYPRIKYKIRWEIKGYGVNGEWGESWKKEMRFTLQIINIECRQSTCTRPNDVVLGPSSGTGDTVNLSASRPQPQPPLTFIAYSTTILVATQK